MGAESGDVWSRDAAWITVVLMVVAHSVPAVVVVVPVMAIVQLIAIQV